MYTDFFPQAYMGDFPPAGVCRSRTGKKKKRKGKTF